MLSYLVQCHPAKSPVVELGDAYDPHRRSTGPDHAALHYLGSITPVREHYTTSELV